MMYLFTDKKANLDQHSKHINADFGSSETIDSTFLTFVNKIFDTLKEEGNFRKVRRNCVQNVNVTVGISLSEDTLDKIGNAEDFDDLYDTLCNTCRPYWNWMNIRMIVKMASDCSPAEKLIEQYKSKVFSRKLKDVLLEIPNLEIPTDKYTEVKEKWKKDFNDVTIEDVVEHWNKLEKKFNVKENMLLKSITEGCVEIRWLLPNDDVKGAMSSAVNSQPVKCDDQLATEEFFPEVLYLKIGEVIVKDDIKGM